MVMAVYVGSVSAQSTTLREITGNCRISFVISFVKMSLKITITDA